MVVWGILGFVRRGKDVDVKKAFRIGMILGILGAILMFPPVFEAFE